MTDLNITVSASDIMSALDYSEIVENLDAGDLWRNLRDEIDYSTIAESVVDYMDIDGLVSDALYNRNDTYLDSDGLMDLMESYNPANTCSLGRETTKTISKGIEYMINDYLTNGAACNPNSTAIVNPLVDLIKQVVGETKPVDSNQATQEGVQSVDNQVAAPVNAEGASLFTMSDITFIVYEFVNRFSYYTTNYLTNDPAYSEFEPFFKEALGVIKNNVSTYLAVKIENILTNQS